MTDRVRMAIPGMVSISKRRGYRARAVARASDELPRLAGRYTIRPSVRKTAAWAARQSRATLCTIVSNTGCGSVWACAIVGGISVVDVWWSRDVGLVGCA